MKESIYDQMTKSEKEVADLLKEMGIKWSYEQPVFVWDENKRPRVWAPQTGQQSGPEFWTSFRSQILDEQ